MHLSSKQIKGLELILRVWLLESVADNSQYVIQRAVTVSETS